MPDVAFKDLCIDVTAGGDRADAVAAFWAAALGQQDVRHDDGDHHLLPPPGGAKERVVWINNVPEASAGKSRVHLDVRVADGDPAALLTAGATLVRSPDDDVRWHVRLVDATVDDLVAAGATLLRAPDDEIDWWVLADPEGNEFCTFR